MMLLEGNLQVEEMLLGMEQGSSRAVVEGSFPVVEESALAVCEGLSALCPVSRVVEAEEANVPAALGHLAQGLEGW